MSGLLRRIRRPGAAEETRTEPIALPEPAHGSAPATTAPVRADGRPLPAGTDPEDLERRATTGRRGKLRRRARFLRRARELALRDLGGLVYEAHRRNQDGSKLVAEKVARLAAIDEELRAIETALGTPRADTVLREPGVGGTCPRCGELHPSDARFCSSCGLDLTAAPADPEAAAGAEPSAPEAAAPQAEPVTPEAAAPQAEPVTPEAAAPEAAAPAADAAAAPAAPEAPAAEPAPTEAPAAGQSANGRATTPETAAHPEPTADTPDRRA